MKINPSIFQGASSKILSSSCGGTCNILLEELRKRKRFYSEVLLVLLLIQKTVSVETFQM
jgi:hypothetical protein